MKAKLSLKGRALALLAQREQSVVELRRKLIRHARLQARMKRETCLLAASLESEIGNGACHSRPGSGNVNGGGSGSGGGGGSGGGSGSGSGSGSGGGGGGGGGVANGNVDFTGADAGSVDLERDIGRGGGRHVGNADIDGDGHGGCDVDVDGDVESVASEAESEVETVIGWLRQHDYLNESRFVESRIHARSGRFGGARIRRELAEHGLSLPPDAAAQLSASEFERAAEVWRRKFGAPPIDRAAQGRQARFLTARGFSADAVRRLVRIDRRAGIEPTDFDID